MSTEASRLTALLSYDVLDTPPEPQFDDIVQLARALCRTPVALVSLVSIDRQWFKARAGFDAHETPLNQSVCAHAIKEREILVIADLTQDERTKANPLVTGPPHIRFYAGAVLRTPEGEALGALCVIDDKPRPGGLAPEQLDALLALARQTMMMLHYRRALANRDRAISRTANYAHSFETAEMAGGVGTFEIDIASNTVFPSPEFCRLFGLTDRRAIDAGEIEALALPEDQGPADKGSILHPPARLAGTTRLEVEYRIRRLSDGEVRWISRRGEFERDAAGKPVRLRGAVQDVTERKQMEARQQTLNQELSHRMKNTLAMVSAIATQTLRQVSDQPAVETFGRRILALGKAHDVLLQQTWQGAPIRSTIEEVVGLAQAGPGRFELNGPDIDISARSVLSFSLLLHELVTNAVKYGALSQDGGKVHVDWHVEGPQLVLVWREAGGPSPVAPTRRGFGSRLIQNGLAGTGQADIRYEQGGLRAEFRAPLGYLAAP
jgi:PAS domain S-box-containing protein